MNLTSVNVIVDILHMKASGSIWNSFQITVILLTIVIFSSGASLEFARAQITIIPGIDEEELEPEAEEELEPETQEPGPEAELGPSQQPQSQQTASGPQRISQELDYAHFIPLTNSPGNQVKLILNYTSDDSSIINEPINAVMEVYSTNQSLIKISSFPEPMIANSSGSLQLATTFTNEEIDNVIVTATITGPEKSVSMSNPLTVNLNLGQIVEQ